MRYITIESDMVNAIYCGLRNQADWFRKHFPEQLDRPQRLEHLAEQVNDAIVLGFAVGESFDDIRTLDPERARRAEEREAARLESLAAKL